MTFVLSRDNEIVIGAAACERPGDGGLRFIVAAVNAWKETP